MPVVIVRWLEGRTKEQKKELVAGLVDLFSRVADVPPENLSTIIEDVPRRNWALGTKFFDE
ncbi:MAG: 4-oxalocrotonate tautomerase family protein [Thermoplasmata archaeon]|nr:4-oxalocrotonate tautomerase family protein [Thermoplasmata archaeon]